jgi:hypothetical protein
MRFLIQLRINKKTKMTMLKTVAALLIFALRDSASSTVRVPVSLPHYVQLGSNDSSKGSWMVIRDVTKNKCPARREKNGIIHGSLKSPACSCVSITLPASS